MNSDLKAELRQLRLVLPALVENEDPDSIRDAFAGYAHLIAARTGAEVSLVRSAVDEMLIHAGVIAAAEGAAGVA